MVSIFSHIRLSSGLVPSAPTPNPEGGQKYREGYPECAPFSVLPPLFSNLPIFPWISSIPLGHKREVASENMEAGYTMGPSSESQASVEASSLRQNQVLA